MVERIEPCAIGHAVQEGLVRPLFVTTSVGSTHLPGLGHRVSQSGACLRRPV